jgi:hypothetical protein
MASHRIMVEAGGIEPRRQDNKLLSGGATLAGKRLL